MNIQRIKDTFSWFLEYVLIVSVILECNSVLMHGVVTESTVNFYYVIHAIIIASAVLLLALKLADTKTLKLFIERFLPILVVMELYAIMYFFLGVRTSPAHSAKKDFIVKFLLMLPVFSSLLFVERKGENKGNDRLLYKYSNVVCIMAFLNLIVYYMSTFHVDELESEIVYLRWYNGGVLSSLVNCLNICYLHPGTMAQSFNIHFLRDFGPFVEPLMFLIPLGTALFVELFLRGKDDKWCLWRCLLLSATIFTVQSTYGLMMLVIAWGLKLISFCNAKERKIVVIPAVALALLGCGYFVAYKFRTFNFELVLDRLMKNKHFTDYVYPLKAFLSKPLLAGGYLSNDLTISFFSEEALKDIGFSNSIAVVLGQGGIILGLLCILPFIIGLLQFFSKSNRQYALFIFGPLYLYTVTVFYYNYILILFFALGYSLLEIEKNKGGGKSFRLRVIQRDSIYGYGNSGNSFLENIKAFVLGSVWKMPILLIILSLLTISFGTGLWNICYKLLFYYQLSSGQSKIRVLYGIISIIALFAWCRVMTKEAETKKQKFIILLYTAIIQIGYAWAYGAIYSYVDTLIQLFLGDRELVRETLILMCYIVFLVIAHIIYIEISRAIAQRNAKRVMIPAGLVAFIGLCLVVGNIVFKHKLQQKLTLIETQVEPLRKVAEVKTGKLYSDELPVLYNVVISDVTYGAIRGEGYRIIENATILEPEEKELTVLFNEGFQVAQISDDHIIYSNDESVISEMTKEGYKFYRYYAFEREIDLEEAAELNGLEISDNNGEKALLIEGEEKSLKSGPYDVLQPGTYTVTFSFKINPDEYSDVPEETLIADVRTSHKNGQKIDQQLEVKKSEFDDRGCADVESIFTVSTVEDGYEYLVFGKEDYDVEIKKLTICQTPNSVTLTKYNVHQNPIYEAYYDEDGNPSYTEQGYAAVEKQYNSADIITIMKYLDENGNPKLTTNGYAEVHYEYDGKMQMIKESYYDEIGEMTTLPKGYSMIRYANDDRGRRIEYRYCDAKGQLTDQPNGVAMIRYSYNDDGRVIRCEYFDHDEEKAILSAGYCAEEYTYNDEGLIATIKYLGVDNRPVKCTDNLVSEIHFFYDEKCRIIRQEVYNTEGERSLTDSGYSALNYERDTNGNVVSEEYYGINDEKIRDTTGVWKVKRVYNDLNQKISEKYFGIDGKLVNVSEKYSMIDFIYNDDGILVKKIFKDKEGNVVEEQIA